MITVGMDVHVRNSYLHVTDDSGKVMRRGRCRNTMMDLAEFLKPIERAAAQRGEPVRTVLECTTNSRTIQRMLMEYGRAAGLWDNLNIAHFIGPFCVSWVLVPSWRKIRVKFSRHYIHSILVLAV